MADNIVIDQELCLNFNYKKMQCRKCQDVCPLRCISQELKVNNEICNQCGLCIASCPAEAVAGISYTNQALQELTLGSSPIALVCKRRNSEAPWACLGFLDTSLLLTLGYSGKQITIDNTACSDCKPGVATYLGSIIEQVNELLAHYGKSLVEQGEVVLRPQMKVVSRRDFFGQLFGAAIETVREVAKPSDTVAEKLERRKFTDHALSALPASASMQTATIFPGIAIDDNCQACGMCAKFCARKAISLVDRTDELDIFHNPLRCTGCQVCAVHCPSQAIKAGVIANQLANHKAITAYLPRCSSCNELYQPVNNQPMCLECMLKNRQQVMW